MRNPFAEAFSAYERPCRIEAAQRLRPNDSSQTWQRIYLQSGNLPIRHISHCFPDSFNEIDVRREHAAKFNHCLHWPDPIPAKATDLVTLLQAVLALPTHDNDCELSLALDWYKDFTEEGEPVNSEVGELVRRAKYFKYSPHIMSAAQAQLAGRLADVVRRHPALDQAPYLVSVPGSKGDGRSAGERIAGMLADLTSKDLVKTVGQSRPERKEDQSCKLEGLFKLPAPLDGPCVIVDDVCRSGTTLREIALLAKNAGAPTVYALVGARTRRN